MNRRLAAIAIADVVGYSRLMEADEAGTLAALKERRKLILEPVVREHGGRIVKFMGDGVLIEFASAVKAVEATIELQRKFAEANQLLPEERRILLRIGINLGDVIGEGSDIYGEGVNIAARLEPLAEPGGIVVSGAAYDQVKKKVAARFDDLGLQSLKNISEEVRAYRVVQLSETVAATLHVGLPAVAVLPFNNMSGDPEQEYFSDGITEDIIAELSHFRTLLVIARNSSFAFKGHAGDLREIGRKLAAQFIVEGSVRKFGNRVRITAQLIDARSGSHLWSERFDRGLDDIFAIQDEVAAGIVGKVAGQVQAAGIERVRRRGGSLAAYDYYLKGREHMIRAGTEDLAQALVMLERAVAEDPNFAPAYALLSDVQIDHALSLWGASSRAERELGLDKALKSAKRAVALDGSDARGHVALGFVQFIRKEFDLAAYHIGVGRRLNPNVPDIITMQCYLKISDGQLQEALDLLEFARKLNPILPNWYLEPWSWALYALGRYAEAANVLERATANSPYVCRNLAASYAQTGEIAKARTTAALYLELHADFSLKEFAATAPIRTESILLHMIEGLRKAGLPE